jgi:hypothetical protein
MIKTWNRSLNLSNTIIGWLIPKLLKIDLNLWSPGSWKQLTHRHKGRPTDDPAYLAKCEALWIINTYIQQTHVYLIMYMYIIIYIYICIYQCVMHVSLSCTYVMYVYVCDLVCLEKFPTCTSVFRSWWIKSCETTICAESFRDDQ